MLKSKLKSQGKPGQKDEVVCTLKELKQIRLEKPTQLISFRVKPTLKKVLQAMRFGTQHIFINDALSEKLARSLDLEDGEDE